MPGITFPAGRADQRVGLLDLLRVLGERGRNSVWLLKNLEVAPSPSADRLHDASDRRLWVPGAELLGLAAGYTQVIDGELIAHESPDEVPWGRAARHRRDPSGTSTPRMRACSRRSLLACRMPVRSPSRSGAGGLGTTMSDLRPGQLVTGVVIQHRPFGDFVEVGEEEPGVAMITTLDDEPRSPDPVLPAVGSRVEGVFLGYSGPGSPTSYQPSTGRYQGRPS